MTIPLMYISCGVFTLPPQERHLNGSPHTVRPITLQTSHHRTQQHLLEHHKLTWTLTLCNLLEDALAPPACLSLRLCSASHKLAITQDTFNTKSTVLTDWQKQQTVRLHTSHFQTSDNWQTANWELIAGRKHMLYLPTSRGLLSTFSVWFATVRHQS